MMNEKAKQKVGWTTRTAPSGLTGRRREALLSRSPDPSRKTWFMSFLDNPDKRPPLPRDVADRWEEVRLELATLNRWEGA